MDMKEELKMDAEAYFNIGYEKYENNDFDGAIENYSKAIEINPEYAKAYIGRRSVRLRNGDFKGSSEDHAHAKKIYRKIIEMNPDDAEAYCNLGNLSNYQLAMENYNKSLKINPYFAAAYLSRGERIFYNGDKVGAMADFQKTIEIEPDNHSAYYWRGQAKASLKDFSGAIDDYSKAIEKCACYHYYLSRGCAKKDMNDDEGAIQDYLKMIDIYPDDFIPYLHLADIYCKRKEYSKAVEYLDKVIKIVFDEGDFSTDEFLMQHYSEEDWNELVKYKTNKINT